jgi:Tol biopolymer transport system component
MHLVPGTRLGPHEILGPIGAGGMGEVYRARDTRLNRDVAIKVLPESLARDPDRLSRFEREAKVLAALNHPNIAHIHGVEDSAGVPALVMELVEGETLADRIARGPIPLDEALLIGKQIAVALEAAHEQRIIHRDLKPANIKLRSDGTVKVLDFGLAKAVGSDSDMPDLAESPTITAAATRAGMILGTAPYMSPEQANGRPVDRRTDLWAFGVVLYELLTGSAAFQGNSIAEVLAHVLTQTPKWERLPADTPASIRTLLQRCLEKNPAKRLDSAVAVRLEIDDALASPSRLTTPGSLQERRRRVTWGVIAALAGGCVIASLATWAVMRSKPQVPLLPARFAITFPPSEPLEFTFRGREIALSPDGRYLAYQSRGRLMLRAFDQLDGVPLSSVTGGRTPFFSPDSRWIGFFEEGDLKKVAVTGDPVITLSRNLGSPEGGTWGDDGTIIVSSQDSNIGLRRVSADGGEATPLTTTAKRRHIHPSMLPGGRGVLFTIDANAPEDLELAVLDLKSGQPKTLLRGGVGVEYIDTGHLVYATVGYKGSDRVISATLWAVAFDLDRLALRGEPVRVSEALDVYYSVTVNYAVSRTGTLAYVRAPAEARSLVWVDRNGQETPIKALPPRPYGTISLSPNGTRVAYAIADREFDIWTWDFAREAETRLTLGPGVEFVPRWTPDGRRIIFQSNRAGPFNLYSVASDRSGAIEQLTTSNNEQWPNSITPDGMTLLACELRPKTGLDIVRFPLAVPQGGGKAATSDERRAEATSLVASPAAEYAANISPDGRYFAYQSTESGGRFAIYVQSFPNVSQRPWRISPEGGKAPVWGRTGRELFYLDESNILMAVPIQTSGTQFSYGKPTKVFDRRYSDDFYSYDVTPDGRRFLMMKESDAGDRPDAPTMIVVLNWFEELKRRVPTN